METSTYQCTYFSTNVAVIAAVVEFTVVVISVVKALVTLVPIRATRDVLVLDGHVGSGGLGRVAIAPIANQNENIILHTSPTIAPYNKQTLTSLNDCFFFRRKGCLVSINIVLYS